MADGEEGKPITEVLREGDGKGGLPLPNKSESKHPKTTELHSPSEHAKKQPKRTLALPDCVGWPAAIVGAATALLAIAGLTPLGQRVIAAEQGRILGQVGYVFYEVNSSGRATSAGELSLLKTGAATVDNIGYGDKLRAKSEKNMRTAPSRDPKISRTIIELDDGDCVVVLKNANVDRFNDNKNADWFKVATSSCGLFN